MGRPKLEVKASNVTLGKLEMKASSIIQGRTYIWRVDDRRQVVVWLNEKGDGLCQHDGDEWYFRNNLVGELYGPFELKEARVLTPEKDFFDLYHRQSNLALEVGHNSIADWNIVIYNREGKSLSECETPDIHIQDSDRSIAFLKAYAALVAYLGETSSE